MRSYASDTQPRMSHTTIENFSTSQAPDEPQFIDGIRCHSPNAVTARPTDDMLADAHRRNAAPRPLVSWLQGDPPPGQSALDKKRTAQEKPSKITLGSCALEPTRRSRGAEARRWHANRREDTGPITKQAVRDRVMGRWNPDTDTVR